MTLTAEAPLRQAPLDQTRGKQGRPTRIVIPYTPHPSQRLVHSSASRFRVLVAGRRWGKTRCACLDLLKQALVVSGAVMWWVAPTYSLTRKGWREWFKHCPREAIAGVSRSEREVVLANGTVVAFKSSENPDSLLSEGLDFVVVDEAARVAEEAWQRALRPALSDKRGGALFATTPAGKNWLYRLWLRGQDSQEPEIASWRFPTSDNPYIVPEEIEAARAMMIDRVFRQEYEAAFEEGAGSVFRNVRECATAVAEAPNGQQVVIGVDWGKHVDATVFVVLDVERRRVLQYERMMQVDYTLQIGRLQALAERWKPRLVTVEINAMGDPLVEQVRRDLSCPVEGFLTTSTSKRQLIEALALATERQEVTFPSEPPELVNELEAFSYEITAAGNVRYSAPQGERFHDDCVMALAFAWHAAKAPTFEWHVRFAG